VIEVIIVVFHFKSEFSMELTRDLEQLCQKMVIVRTIESNDINGITGILVWENNTISSK